MDKFRLKLLALWLAAFACFLVLESGLPAAYRNTALAVFAVLAVGQFFVRCEECGSSFVHYLTDSRDGWAKSVNFVTAIFSSQCPKCGAKRI